MPKWSGSNNADSGTPVIVIATSPQGEVAIFGRTSRLSEVGEPIDKRGFVKHETATSLAS